MVAYRLYCLDGANKFNRAEWLEAETDEEALALVPSRRKAAIKAELWQGSRLIARFDQDVSTRSGS